ncbi:unnamed protein product [Linum trigynum]|uniref:CCHC-type domain-containing protein n=1 Tax=Linum trigynum TaxID=586398 RepID=A0AAV2GMU8_9ROSI
MLEGIRGYMMERVVIKYNMLHGSTVELCPRIRKRLEKEKEFARLCVSRQSHNMRCEVKMGAEGYIVDLTSKECSCVYLGNLTMQGHAQHLLLSLLLELWNQAAVTRNGPAAATRNAAAAATRNVVVAAPHNESQPRQRRGNHCSKCGSATHNARTCPLNRGVGIQDVRLNVGDRITIERELRQATRGIGVYVDETTGNQYVRLNGANGRFVGNPPPTQPTEMDLPGSQPSPTQP